MKGIILAAGLGKRLMPFTAVTPKPLLPMKDKFLINYSIDLLEGAGIKDIAIVASPQHASCFATLFEHQLIIQREANGIAHALYMCKDWVQGHSIVVTLADTVFLPKENLKLYEFMYGAKCFSYEVPDPWWCGCVKRENDKVVDLVEKPGHFWVGNEVLIGLYMYDETVFKRIETLKYSDRKELEITDLNKSYLASGDLVVEKFDGIWHDAGTDLDAYIKTWEIFK